MCAWWPAQSVDIPFLYLETLSSCEDVRELSVHALSGHTLSVHALSVHALSVHAQRAHALSVHALSVHAPSAHSWSVHVPNVYALSVERVPAQRGCEMVEPRLNGWESALTKSRSPIFLRRCPGT